MKKMKLNLEQLAVDSFDTSAAPQPRGTVFGEEYTNLTHCSCPGHPSCDGYDTCQGSPSCDGVCTYTQGNDTCDITCHGAFTCELSCDYGPSCYYTCITCEYTCPTCVYTCGCR
jgi:hypothetical protein